MKAFFMTVMLLSAAAGAVGLVHAADACLACHEQKTPGIVQYWRNSAHFAKNIGCSECHGNDPDACHSGKAVVTAAKCGRCHEKQLLAHRESKHGIAQKAGAACTRNEPRSDQQKKSCSFCHEPNSDAAVKTGSARFLAQTREMRRQGCTACHRVEAQCDACHTKHETDLALARDPGTCGTCHMGPDHPQKEAWETSRHGVLFAQNKKIAPSCGTCHMRDGSHNVSKGISSSLPTQAGAQKKQEREYMLAICSGCHTRRFAMGNLADADAIEEQSLLLVNEARQIVEALDRDGLLAPSPAQRPPHPLSGHTLVTDRHMLYENLSYVESLFFKMNKFYAPTAYKGAFHQNPDYAHWYGNAPLKLTLSEIRSEAALLRRIEALRKRTDTAKTKPEEGKELQGIQEKLRQLDDQRLKSEISEQDYQKKKNEILDKAGL